MVVLLETGGILEARQLYTKTCTALFFSVLYKLNNLHTYGSTKKRKRSERKMINIKSKTQKGITLIALVVNNSSIINISRSINKCTI